MPSVQIPLWPQAVSAHGNTAISARRKTAFLCSRNYPASAVLRIYDWAKEMRTSGECVISGFHSRLERDVLDILLDGTQPVILTAARSLPKRYDPSITRAIAAGRLLALSPFPPATRRVTADTAQQRNTFMLTVADHIVIGHASNPGSLAQTLQNFSADKSVVYLSD